VKGARVWRCSVGEGHLKAEAAGLGEVQNLLGQEVQWSPRFLQNWASGGGLIAVTYLWPETAEANQNRNRHRRRCLECRGGGVDTHTLSRTEETMSVKVMMNADDVDKHLWMLDPA